MEKFKKISKNNIEQLPKTAGVYLFFARRSLSEGGLRKPIYIGKAINIKNRVKNHFYPVKYREAVISPKAKLFNRVNQPSYRDNLFIDKITKIGFIETDSEIEALVLEANLIKKYQPKFNIIWKDDKNYFYVAIAKNKNKIPYIFITHQPKLQTTHYKLQTSYIGPFVEGTALKKTLRFLRRIFPYYTTTLRRGSGQIKHPKNNCTYCHLGLCPGPLLFENPPSPKASAGLREYKKNIKKLVFILKGKTTVSGGASLTAGKTVLNTLKKEMRQLSLKKEFEKAIKIRDRISNLQQVMSHTKIIEAEKIKTNDWNKTEKILRGITGINRNISRIEAYDVSNIQGKQATGVMIVFINGKPDKNLYRKFKIKIMTEPNDIAMLKETLGRRFSHPEWELPEIILMDGGIAQLNIGIKVKNQKSETKNIKVISIAKRFKELFIENRKTPVLLKTLPQEIFNLIMNLDNEAHRFAITYHKELRKKYLLNNT